MNNKALINSFVWPGLPFFVVRFFFTVNFFNFFYG